MFNQITKKIDLSNIILATNKLYGYSNGQDFTTEINGDLIGISWVGYNAYNLVNFVINYLDGSIESIGSITNNITKMNRKRVKNVTYRIDSDNSHNGFGVITINYQPLKESKDILLGD